MQRDGRGVLIPVLNSPTFRKSTTLGTKQIAVNRPLDSSFAVNETFFRVVPRNQMSKGP